MSAEPYSLAKIKHLAYLLDNRFKIPFTRYRVGWDFLLGLIPVAGDFLTALVSIYILLASRHYSVPKQVWLKMIINIVIDFLIGLVPIIGDIADAAWKANAKNVNLLVKAIENDL